MLDIWQKWGCDIWEETEKMWGFSFCTSREIALSRASLAQEQHGLPSTDGSECVDGGRAGVERMTDLLQRRLLRRQREQLFYLAPRGEAVDHAAHARAARWAAAVARARGELARGRRKARRALALAIRAQPVAMTVVRADGPLTAATRPAVVARADAADAPAARGVGAHAADDGLRGLRAA